MSDSKSPTPQIPDGYWNEYNGRGLFQANTGFLVVSTVLTWTRLLARFYVKKTRFGWDDAFVLGGWISLIGLSIDTYLSLNYGVGYHIQRVILEWPWLIPHWGRSCLYAFPMIYCLATTLPKLSILALYLRIFTNKFTRWACWGLGAITVLNLVANELSLAWQCNPREKAWSPTSPGTCINIFLHLAFGGLANIVTDAVMLALPLPTLWHLQVPRSVKTGLVAIFLLGGVGLITSVLRFAEFVEIDYSVDGTYLATPLLIYAMAESHIYQMSACLLACRPVLTMLGESRLSSAIYGLLRGRTSTSSRGHIPLHDYSAGHKSPTAPRGQKMRKGASDTTSTEAFAAKRREEDTDGLYKRPDQIHVRHDFEVRYSPKD